MLIELVPCGVAWSEGTGEYCRWEGFKKRGRPTYRWRVLAERPGDYDTKPKKRLAIFPLLV